LFLFLFSFSYGFWLLFSVLLICRGMCCSLSLSVHSRVSTLVAWTRTLCHISAQLQPTKWKLSDPFALSTSGLFYFVLGYLSTLGVSRPLLLTYFQCILAVDIADPCSAVGHSPNRRSQSYRRELFSTSPHRIGLLSF
jgi:hypothetical protein